ncbi:ABC transporter substrate-binding protein [Sulfitobacter sp. SK012]|uniref:ABC transporter substrate-binding protein n=1 Tax=Sulfitobacter sp. SK012 TaxID=1389005 RepID=UPI0013B458BD|nr:ABC transporter substrate-binding protein [Sulfitobacter sp. SK012]
MKLSKICALARFTLLCALAFALVLFGGATQAQDAKPWIVAVAGPMTGESAHLGKAMVDATRLKAEEINKAGGVNGRSIEVAAYDDQNSPELAAKVALEIATQSQAVLVIGHRTSGASIAAAPVYMEHGIAAITGTATADALTVNNPWYFRATYNNKMQAEFSANYISSVLGYRTATLVATDDAYGRSLRDAFKASSENLRMDIAHLYDVDPESPDIDLDMADIVAELSLMPDSGMVFLAMNAVNAAHFVREMRNSGFALPIFGADSINQTFPSYFEPDPILKTRPGDFTDQILATTSMIWDVANEDAIKFRNEFADRFGTSPDSGMALYYDAAGVSFKALASIDASISDLTIQREGIRNHFASLDTRADAYEGITGKIFFDDIGNAEKTVPVGVFELGEFISAPVQLQAVENPVMVPNFSDKLESGEIVPQSDGYMHATQIVYFGVDLNEVSNLNTATGNYDLDFYLWLRYRGKLDLNKIEFSNAVTPINLDNPIWKRERNGMNIVTFKVRGTFSGEFQFADYPFDRQHITLVVRHQDRNSESMRFVADRLGMLLADENSTLLAKVEQEQAFKTSKGWRVLDAQIYQDLIKTASTLGETRFFQGETEVNFSRMVLSLEIGRHLTSYSSTILLPMTILFTIGLLLFAVPIQELPPRLSGGILVLVTVSLLRARLSNDLPNIGYLVAIDYIFFALQIIMLFGILVSVLSYWLLASQRSVAASRVNKLGAVLYPIPILAVGFYIWFTISIVAPL